MNAPFNPDPSVWRALDANLNRCLEGLRVLEDLQRFCFNHQPTAEGLKHLRHDLQAAIPPSWHLNLIAQRDVQGDIGRSLEGSREYERLGWDDLLGANLSRCQQALRVLEEFSKLLDGSTARRLEQLRYRLYDLGQQCQVGVRRQTRLAQAQLYVLQGPRKNLDEFRAWCRDLVAAGPDVIQLRLKSHSDREILEHAQILRELTAGTSVLLIMNDRPDLAHLVQADGVHVGQDELLPQDVRQIVGNTALVGVSTHAPQQAQAAIEQQADYLGAGPTFPSQTKDFGQFPGLAYLREVAQVQVPVFAIGGIDLSNLDGVLETGIRRVAVAGCVARAAEPGGVIAELRERLQRARLELVETESAIHPAHPGDTEASRPLHES